MVSPVVSTMRAFSFVKYHPMIKNIFRAIGVAACIGLITIIVALTGELPVQGNEVKLGLVTFCIVLLIIIAIWLVVYMFIDSYS